MSFCGVLQQEFLLVMQNFNKLRFIFNRLIHLTLLGGFLFISCDSIAQSGWTKPKGELFSRIGYQYFSSDRYFNLSGNETNTNTFIQHAITLYGEYGLSDRLTLLMDWPAFKAHRFESTETITGMGDVKLGVKYALSKKIPLSLSILPEVPIARANRLAQNNNPDFGSINLPTGDGEFNVFNILSGSVSFYPLPIYSNAFIAYNLRTGYEDIQLSDQVLYGVEVGGKLFDVVWLKTALKLQQSLDQSSEVVSFVRGEGTEYTSLNLGLFVPFKNGFGVDFNYFDFIDFLIPRRNIYDAPAFSIGLVYEIKNQEDK